MQPVLLVLSYNAHMQNTVVARIVICNVDCETDHPIYIVTMTKLNAEQLKKILSETLSPIAETRRAGTK